MVQKGIKRIFCVKSLTEKIVNSSNHSFSIKIHANENRCKNGF